MAESYPHPVLAATTDRDPLSYSAGDPMVFTFRAAGAPAGSAVRWRSAGDDMREAGGEAALAPNSQAIAGAGGRIAGCSAQIRTSLGRPGFIRIEADLVAPSGKTLAHFCGGAGADVGEIRADTPEPPDFDEFWARRKSALAAVPMEPAVVREMASPCNGVRVFEVSLPCPGGRPCTAMLSVPSSGGRFPGCIRLRGYNASWGEVARNTPGPGEVRPDAVVLFLSSHGFEFNREPEYYDALRAASGSNGWDFAFDPVQNSNPDTAYFGGMAWRVMRGVEYLRSRPEWNGRDICAMGGSQGGLQSIWAAALCDGVTECRPRIPWCCNMAGPENGRVHGDWFVPWVPALAYYDPVNMARRIPATCRVEIPEAGLGDYVSPPSGVMAFYNALRCPKRAEFIQGMEHFDARPERSQASVLQSRTRFGKMVP